MSISHSIINHAFSPNLLTTTIRACNAKASQLPPSSRTQRIMESISVSNQVGGAGGASSYTALKRLDHLLTSLCSATGCINSIYQLPGEDQIYTIWNYEMLINTSFILALQEPPQIVTTYAGSTTVSDFGDNKFDVLVCGGTLGIFVALTLCSKGLRVGIVERSLLKGREQEWNISQKELLELIDIGILGEDDAQDVTQVKFNPNRCGFEGKGEIWVEDILNLGISPVKLIEVMKKRFTSLGGVVFEGYGVASISVYDDAAIPTGTTKPPC